MVLMSTPSEPALVRVRLVLAYDGTDYKGWAVQPHLPTVQGALEGALATIIRRPVRTVVAGRTDSGVHARGQVVHFDLTDTEWNAVTRGRAELDPGPTLVRRLGGALSHEHGALVVTNAARAPEGFDARFSALWRSYSYSISDALQTRDPLNRRFTHWHKTPLDVELMDAEARSVLGLHDFLTFCKPRDGATTIRELQDFGFTRDPQSGIIRAHLQADAFCHNMVRALVAACMQVGEGRHPAGWVAQRLGAMVRDSQTRLAPPHALVLEHVEYPDVGSAPNAFAARAEGTRAKRRL
ncbi:tRNA pseudouridine(38-40) synthase TruA [Citricoccus sp. GCM10030269]|uniref:tRNA pseudouridine(38-40) synthase TruA n=1 Tax=Citricoccus sp. GCM10030269 TaxID=3273388 RepID=UPI00360F0483